MTLADYSMTAFAVLNGGRVLAYMPQILCIYRCRNGAAAVSLMTWLMFTAANVATVAYALTVSSDLIVATIFALNALFCVIITALIAFRRMAWSEARHRACGASAFSSSAQRPPGHRTARRRTVGEMRG